MTFPPAGYGDPWGPVTPATAPIVRRQCPARRCPVCAGTGRTFTTRPVCRPDGTVVGERFDRWVRCTCTV